jgi:hypothetical protein
MKGVDYTRSCLRVEVPDLLQDLPARNRHAAPGPQEEQQRQLLGGERVGLALALELEALGVDRGAPDHEWRLDLLRLAGAAHAPAQEGARAGEQNRQRERLGQVVVRAEVEPAHDVARRVERREQQDRHPVLARAELLHHLEAREPGQHHVEHDEIDRRRGDESLERRLAALGDLDPVALRLEIEREPAGQVLLVLDEQDARLSRHGRGG